MLSTDERPDRVEERRFDSWQLLDSLLRLGNFYQLDFHLSSLDISADLKKFSDCWVQYNPYKPQIPRKGLSVTSLDGGMSGRPDLYSLREFYRREGVLYHERDFRKFTPVYEGCFSIRALLDYFHPYVCRTHFLRFDAGGYFPPHRDGAAVEKLDTIRILVPITPAGKSSFVFLHGENRIYLDSGSVYFLNTLIAHSVFSFVNGVTFLVCNIELNADTVARLKAKLWDK